MQPNDQVQMRGQFGKLQQMFSDEAFKLWRQLDGEWSYFSQVEMASLCDLDGLLPRVSITYEKSCDRANP